MAWKDNYRYWIENAPKDVVKEIQDYSDEQKEEYFTGDLEFGTAGIRGIMGYGTNVLNEFLVAKFAHAYGKFLLHTYHSLAKMNGIVIAHDNRRNNILYSETVAEVVSAMGIPVFLFHQNELQPTPLLSYTISKGNYVGGVNITASHNPPEYSGLKIYNHTGSQSLPVDTNEIIKYSKEDIDIFNIARSKDNIKELSESIVKQYIDKIMAYIPFSKYDDEKNLKVVFTSQHGTSGPIATRIMDRMNVNYELVKEQMNPDPEFTNTPSPNPQNPDSFIMARKLGDKVEADVLFCTDPDADRFGIEVKHKGKWIHIDGNQLPLIQINHKLRKLKELNYLHHGDFMVKSVVTSKAAELIAHKYGVHVYDSLTGFKWIIAESDKHEMQGNECLFAWEESYGSTVRSFTKDKDSFQALVQVIEIAEEYKQKNKTLVDALVEIFEVIGFWYSPQEQFWFEGLNAMKDMNSIVEKAREFKVGDKLGKYKITEVIDFQEGYKELPKDNFVQIVLNNDHRITVRPSGTEPVLRIYFDIVADSDEATKEIFEELKQIVEELKPK